MNVKQKKVQFKLSSLGGIVKSIQHAFLIGGAVNIGTTKNSGNLINMRTAVAKQEIRGKKMWPQGKLQIN